jgi:transposase-like protein
MEYCHQREQQGANINGIALELGVSTTSLMRWSRKAAESAEGFRAVELVVGPESSAVTSKPARLAGTVVVHGPRGLRVEGLTVAELAELIDRLS